MKKIFTIIVLSSLVFITTLLAQGQFGTKIFTKCDDSQDGFLDKKEYLKMSSKRFNRMDKNKDGKVTFDELSTTFLAKMMPLIAASWFERNDVNQDKTVTTKEMKQMSDTKFEVIDDNSDGKLSAYEWQNSNPSFNKK